MALSPRRSARAASPAGRRRSPAPKTKVQAAKRAKEAPATAADNAANQGKGPDAAAAAPPPASPPAAAVAAVAAARAGARAAAPPREPETEYEFFGPIGVAVIMLALPATAYALYGLCNERGCSLLPLPPLDLAAFAAFWRAQVFLSWEAAGAVAGWLGVQLLAYLLVPGTAVRGLPMEDGTTATYRMNGLASFLLFTGALAAAQAQGWIDLAFAHDHFLELLTTAFLLVLVLSVYVYAVSFTRGVRLAHSGNTGNVVYDFWMGRAFAPMIGPVDLKFFCEQRPGLMAWLAINAGCWIHQYRQTQELNVPMLLVNVFHYLYVLDTFVFERAVLSTADITTEGFGFMLCFGDLVWVPFTYSLQARYLSHFPVELSTPFLVGIVALFVAGFAIFRLSNLEKDRFRRNPQAPEVRYLETIPTRTGSRLIVSGWWGLARHINYLGDWLLSLAGCLACGVDHTIPYFFVLYFGILLVHRERRDDAKCSKKYQEAWAEYQRRVPWRIVPYLY